MLVDTDNLVSMTEANQNFSKVARLVDEKGSAIVLKNNLPRYVIIEYSQLKGEELADKDEVTAAAQKILNKYLPAFKELAK
jgi:antitoxin Phd